MSEDRFVGGLSPGPHGGEQGAVEPPPVLITALQIKVGRPAELLTGFENRRVAHPGVEPDIEDVGLLSEVSASAGRAGSPRREEVGGRLFQPDVGAVFGEEVVDVLHNGFIDQQLAAALAIEDGDGHPPGPLPGDAPVRPVFDHPVNPVPSPARNPFDPVDFGQRLPAESGGVHRDKPLGRGPEDHGPLAAPAVRIGVGHGFFGHKGAHLLQASVDPGVGFENLLAGKGAGFFGEPPLVIDRAVNFKAVFEAHLVVLTAVTGGGVDTAGAGLQGDVIPEDEEALPVIERMAAALPLQGRRLDFGEDLIVADPESGHAGRDQVPGQNQGLSVAHPHGGINKGWVEGDAEVGRDRPGGGGPDHHRCRPAGQGRDRVGDVVDQGEFDENRG